MESRLLPGSLLFSGLGGVLADPWSYDPQRPDATASADLQLVSTDLSGTSNHATQVSASSATTNGASTTVAVIPQSSDTHTQWTEDLQAFFTGVAPAHPPPVTATAPAPAATANGLANGAGPQAFHTIRTNANPAQLIGHPDQVGAHPIPVQPSAVEPIPLTAPVVTPLHLNVSHTFPGTIQISHPKPTEGGRSVNFSTYDGGPLKDQVNSVTKDPAGDTFVGGFTTRTVGGFTDGFIDEFDVVGHVVQRLLATGPKSYDHLDLIFDPVSNMAWEVCVSCQNPQQPPWDVTIICYDTSDPDHWILVTTITFTLDFGIGDPLYAHLAIGPGDTLNLTSSFLHPDGSKDTWVAQLDNHLNVLNAVTVSFPGSNSIGKAIGTDADGNVYVGGTIALSSTENAALFYRLNADFASVPYAFYWPNVNPGSAGAINGVVVAGDAFYMTGAVNDAKTPSTPDHKDLVLAKVDTATGGTGSGYAYYWTVPGGDFGGYDLTVDGAGDAFVPTSVNGPPSAGVVDIDGALVEFSPTGDTIVGSQRFGNLSPTSATVDRALAVSGIDASGTIATAGYTESPDFDPLINANQPVYGGGGDGFVASLTLPL
jgi:hypothetical protein